MKRGFLEELGLEKETINKIMSEYGNDVEGSKKEIEQLKAELEALQTDKKELESQISKRDGQLEELKKTNNVDELKAQIEQLQTDNKEIRINSALEKALIQAGAKNSLVVKPLLDLANAELKEDGTIKGLDEQIKKIAKENDYLFETKEVKTETTQTPITGMTPASPSDDSPKTITKDEFNRLSYSKRVELYNENKELYDSLTNN